MHSFYDYKKFAILYVDDEEKSLKYFTRAFEEHFRVYTASNAADGFRLLEQHKDDIGVVITDQRMPGEKGVQLLEKARQLRPKIIRMLATAFADYDAAVDAVNSGAIYKYLHKPWDVPHLDMTLRRALEFFIVQRERDSLMREKLAVLHHIMITDRVVSLGVLAAGLGHHLRNSLVAVRTFIDLAPDKMREEKVDVDELRNPNFWQDFYEHVQIQVRRILDMLSDLGFASETSRAPAEFNDAVNLRDLVNETFASQQALLGEKRISGLNNIPADLPPMNVDKRKIVRMFELLLRDEAASLPPGAGFEITATKLVGSELDQVQITLRDNGPGLPQEALRSIFDPFYVRADNPQEFGLNLMACFFIVYHHGGQIQVRNNEGGGASFIITLPINPLSKPPDDEKDFLAKVLSNENLWERLLSGNA
jgi:two-component system, probable response regulator PhcQ